MPLRLRRVLFLGAAAVLLAACIPVAPPPPPPPVVQTCDPHFRGYVLPSDHNYAGIGAYNGSDRYMCKPTVRQGVRAQVQHLRNYADPSATPYNLGAPLETRPRYDASNYVSFVYHGAAPRWIDLNGKWAVPGTTYGQRILQICGEAIGLPTLDLQTSIMGPNILTAEQLAARVRAIGNPWKPEVSPETMAAIYIEEGSLANVRGDIAFCQSILETGWFSWPSSPASAGTTSADEPDHGTTPPLADPGATTTTLEGDPTTTSSTTTVPPAPAVDPVLEGYFELQNVTRRY